MSEIDVHKALRLLAQRRPQFHADFYCFKEQLAFIQDPNRFKAACCSRRAGKTIGIAAYLLETALRYPDTASLYFTITRLQAKRIIWEPLKKLVEQFGIAAEPHETELTLKFANQSVIYLSGAKDKEEIKKYLGFPLKLAVGDEAQSFKPYLQELVDEVISPTLFDWAGTLALIGTPGPVPVGYFYDMTHNPKWGNHMWTMLDNPHLKLKSGREPMDLIKEECDRRGLTLDDPSIQRSCFGKWANDSNARVFRWEAKNHYEQLPAADSWDYVFGVDLGYDDADAIGVLGWSAKFNAVYLVDEVVKPKQGITELALELERLIKLYKPLSIVMDTGGLGKKIAEEMVARHALPIKPAQKSEKYAHIELVNDALRTQCFYARRTSQFAEDSWLLEWDRDKSSGDRLSVSDAFHSDICDAVLYAFREAQHWLKYPTKAKAPKLYSAEWYQAEVARMEEAAQSQLATEIAQEKGDYWGEPNWEQAI